MSLLEIEQIQSSFCRRSRSEQRQFLFAIVIASAKRTIDTLCSDGYAIGGNKLCRKALMSVLGISHKRLRTVTKLVAVGAIATTPNTAIARRRKTDKVQIACAWMENYFKRIGDKMPHTQQVHLPNFLSKMSVYEQMIQELAAQGHADIQRISLLHFYPLWNNQFSYCIIPKVSEWASNHVRRLVLIV